MTIYFGPIYMTEELRKIYLEYDNPGYWPRFDTYPAYEYSSIHDRHYHIVHFNTLDDSFAHDNDFTETMRTLGYPDYEYGDTFGDLTRKRQHGTLVP